jgi:hypothetical protein
MHGTAPQIEAMLPYVGAGACGTEHSRALLSRPYRVVLAIFYYFASVDAGSMHRLSDAVRGRDTGNQFFWGGAKALNCERLHTRFLRGKPKMTLLESHLTCRENGG